MAFRNTLLEQIVGMPDLPEHWLYNTGTWKVDTLGDKNESVTETNKIGSTHITALSPIPLTPCTSTIKDIETLINKVQDFPILWDKSFAECKNALKKIVSASIANEITLKVRSSKIQKVQKFISFIEL